jgi:predicted dehydrogenase
MNKLRVAVVGMGIGRNNGRALMRNPRGRIVALCDLIPERMLDFAKEIPDPVRTYTDYRELCRDSEVDAVVVCPPNQWHVPIALEAVRHGKHVLVTKPLSDAEESARQLVEAAEAAGVVNMMSLSTRFSDEVRYLGQLCREGSFGELYYGRATIVRRSGIPDWNLGFIQRGGGAFRDIGVHFLDSAWWLMGMPQPERVLGVAGARFGPRGAGYWSYRQPPVEYSREFAVDDFGGGFIRFANGAGLQVEAFWASHQPASSQIALFGDQGGAQMQPLTLYRTVHGMPQTTAVELPKDKEAWDHIAAHFIACVLDGVPCEAPLRHGLEVQRMMEGLLRSADTGKEVVF